MEFSDMTYDAILDRMLSMVNTVYPDLDTREGSLLYNALAPTAIELAIGYTEIQNALNESFVLTATREYILAACLQVGIDIDLFNASQGVHKGVFNTEIDIGTRWNHELYNYEVIEAIGTETVTINEVDTTCYTYKLKCETAGTEPNNTTGQLTPIDYYPTGLTYAQLTSCLVEGENEYTDDEIRLYYFTYVQNAVGDGNVAQYQRWCSEYDGIGNYKIIPLWNGDNSVKVSILSTSNQPASSTLVSDFQEHLDSCTIDTFTGDGTTTAFELTATTNPSVVDMVRVNGTVSTEYTYSLGTVTFISAPADDAVIEVRYNGGMGNGKAPIGAFVTVSTATTLPVNISATVTLAEGYSAPEGLNDALTALFSTIAYKTNQVNYMQIGATILSVPSVTAVSNLTVNSGTADITLADEEIPVLGTTDWTVSD